MKIVKLASPDVDDAAVSGQPKPLEGVVERPGSHPPQLSGLAKLLALLVIFMVSRMLRARGIVFPVVPAMLQTSGRGLALPYRALLWMFTRSSKR